MTAYAEYLLARPKKPALTSAQSSRRAPTAIRRLGTRKASQNKSAPRAIAFSGAAGCRGLSPASAPRVRDVDSRRILDNAAHDAKERHAIENIETHKRRATAPQATARAGPAESVQQADECRAREDLRLDRNRRSDTNGRYGRFLAAVNIAISEKRNAVDAAEAERRVNAINAARRDSITPAEIAATVNTDPGKYEQCVCNK